jgi:predicted flap endonuclease-1-like 5' DNA nuclease
MATIGEEPAARPRQTLAMRLAERERQRAERAERLARLRPGTGEIVPATTPPVDDDAEAALEAFLRALTVSAGAPAPEYRPEPEPAAVLHFQRPEAPEAATDLERLPGAGPGLVGALRRAGLTRLADIAPLAPEALAARLGPIGRQIPAEAWVAAARAAVPQPRTGAGDPARKGLPRRPSRRRLRRAAEAARTGEGYAMAARDAFTAEEWARLVAAPMLAGIAVTAADPGGIWGAVKESVAVAGAVRAATADADPLVAEIASAYETAEGRDMARGALKSQARGKPPAAVVEAAIAELAAVAGLVAAKAPAAAPGFRAWLKAVAAKVAEAGSEGGFLGFGGEKVSAAETATLDRIATALG